jgi:hypothetical protein
MTATAKVKSSVVSIEGLLGQQGELFKRLLKESLQEVLPGFDTAGGGSMMK